MNISQKIYLLRNLFEITQAELAKIAQVSNKAVSAWESETRSPKIEPMQRICAHYGINLQRFIDTSNDYYGQPGYVPTFSRTLSQREIVESLDQLTDDDIAFLQVLVQARIDSHKAKGPRE